MSVYLYAWMDFSFTSVVWQNPLNLPYSMPLSRMRIITWLSPEFILIAMTLGARYLLHISDTLREGKKTSRKQERRGLGWVGIMYGYQWMAEGEAYGDGAGRKGRTPSLPPLPVWRLKIAE